MANIMNRFNAVKYIIQAYCKAYMKLLNDRQDQNFAEKPDAQKLLHAFCRLTDTTFYASKSLLVSY